MPSIYDKPTKQPNEQRFKAPGGRGKRVQLNPERNYFTTCAAAAGHLKTVNDALDKLATTVETDSATQQQNNTTQGERHHNQTRPLKKTANNQTRITSKKTGNQQTLSTFLMHETHARLKH